MPLDEAQKQQRVAELLEVFAAHEHLIKVFQDQLHTALDGSTELGPHVHSIRARTKDPDHLAEKLMRKMKQTEDRGEEFDITPENLLTKINDLAGVRILHLYTRQIEAIDPILRDIFSEQQYELIEGPFARTWDDEYREFFKHCGIETELSPTMYTSVHYVVSSASRTTLTCEVQVRTLMEEVWGEVDHALNYPEPTSVFASQEQIKVLARATSAATRLVDSIFLTHANATKTPE